MSEKTVAEKMYIKPGMQIGLFNAPDDLSDLLGELPDGVDISENLEGVEVDLILGFMEDKSMLETYLSSLKEAIKTDGSLWIAYQKGSSPGNTELSRDTIYDFAQSIDLKGVGMVSIDEDWSGFRFKKV